MASKKPAKKAAKKAAPARKPAKKAPPPKKAAVAKAAPKKANGTPAATAVSSSPSGAFASADLARAQLAKLPPLDAVTRTAFARQVTMPELARLGGQTIAINVLREAGSWVMQIAEGRATHPELARRYGETRFAYFCERVVALEDQLVKEGVRDQTISVARSSERGALEAARIERDHLVGMLEPIVRGEPVTSGQIMGVKADPHDDALVKALGKLAVVAETWLDRAETDIGARHLVRAFGLGDDDVARARAAAAAVTATAGEGATRQRRPGQDSAETNVLEGIVLAEMRVAMNVFRAAATRDPSLPVLIPGPGTRAALGTHTKYKAGQEPSASATATPA